MQKALVVYSNLDETLDELNELLEKGYKVVSATPMGGGGQTGILASLVVVEK